MRVKRAGKKTRAAKAASEHVAASAAVARACRGLLKLIAPDHQKAHARVELALTAPAKYAARYAEEREDRNVEEDEPVDPWLELVSTLSDERVGLASAADWKSPAEDIAAGLRAAIAAHRKLRGNNALYDGAKLFAFYDEDAHVKTKTIDFIRLCGRALSAHGLALVELDIDSDSYELTLIPYRDLPRGVALAKAAGGKLVLHGPKKPDTKPLPTAAAKSKGRPLRLEKRKLSAYLSGRGSAQLPGVPMHPDRGGVTLVDLRSWPPKMTPLIPHGRSVVMRDDGATIAWSVDYRYIEETDEFEPRPEGFLRITLPGKKPVDVVSALPDEYRIQGVAWIDGLAVILPDGPTARESVKRPLVWDGKHGLSPAKGLPDAKLRGGRDPREGHARTGTGVDVLLWEGAGWVRKRDGFVRAYGASVGDYHLPHVGVPAPGDAFFTLDEGSSRATLFRSDRKGVKKAVVLDFRVLEPPSAAPGGRVLLRVNRVEEPSLPALVVYHPESAELTIIPAATLGLRRDDSVEAAGVTEPAKGDAFLWIVDDYELRRVPWEGVLALPRVPAKPR